MAPDTVYTDALCGVVARLSTRKLRDLAEDPRVKLATADGGSSGG